MLAAVVVLHVGQGATFFFGDEWAFLLHRRGISLRTFLETHNEHPVVGPVAVYKLLLQVFGLRTYLPYRLVVTGLHLATGVLVYLYARPRLGAWPALLPVALLLFLGAAWEDILWPFQIGFIGSVTFGVAMLLAFDARRDGLACLALLVSVTSSGIGVPFVVIAAVEIALDPRRRDRWWVAAVPAAALATILAGFRSGQSAFAEPSHVVRYALDMAAAGFGAFGALGQELGRSMLLAGLALLIATWRRAPAANPRMIALACGAAAFWLITASGRADFPLIGPATSRYVYPSATLLLLLFVTRFERLVVSRGVAAIVAVATALACVSGADVLRQAAIDDFLPNASLLPAELAALETARGHVAPDVHPDVASMPAIDAPSYFSAIDAFGSPAPSADAMRAAPEIRRQWFDAALARVLDIRLAPARAQAAGPAPAVEAARGGRVATEGACDAFRPARSGGALDVTVPTGTYLLAAEPGPRVALRLRRIARGYASVVPRGLALRGGAAASLTLPSDRLEDPWHLQLVSSQTVRVCATR